MSFDEEAARDGLPRPHVRQTSTLEDMPSCTAALPCLPLLCLYCTCVGVCCAACAQVIAHENLPARFDRYKLTRGYNSVINSRQFQAETQWPAEYRYPDQTYSSHLCIDVGGVEFQLYHDKGETDDATWYGCAHSCACAVSVCLLRTTRHSQHHLACG